MAYIVRDRITVRMVRQEDGSVVMIESITSVLIGCSLAAASSWQPRSVRL